MNKGKRSGTKMEFKWVLVFWLEASHITYSSGTSPNGEGNFSERNLTSIPSNLQSYTKVDLSNNCITLNDSDNEVLRKQTQLKELNLRNNCIKLLQNQSFSQLENLTRLDVSFNIISQIEINAFDSLRNLQKMNLSSNKISYFTLGMLLSSPDLDELDLSSNMLANIDTKENKSPMLTKINLSENPWNCSCDFLEVQTWLNSTNITILKSEKTVCQVPDCLKGFYIQNASVCQNSFCGNASTKSPFSVSSTTVALSDVLPTIINANNTGMTTLPNQIKTTNSSGMTDSPAQGKSWHFLVGVVVTALLTCFLITLAIKVPTWYKHLFSLRHHRLQEEEPHECNNEYNFHLDSDWVQEITENTDDDTLVSFEPVHSFPPEEYEDGFIEDRYIEASASTYQN